MSAPVREGEVLAGKYRIERVLGEGGMGVVVAATHLQLEQRVAIKFLLPQAMEIPEVVSRFSREARAAAKIQSEHVARVIDVATLENGAPYMVMEYLEGKDLAQVLEERGSLPVNEAAEYALQACEALAEAHAAGIVHRDLKPANLFLARRADKTSSIKVLDFGISKALGAAVDGVQTKTSALMGSPFYMSPEQMTNSRNVDPRSDVWAMGVILYELTTGKTPFFGESMPEIVAAILSATPTPLAEVRPGLDSDVQTIVTRCLEKNPKDRFANVAELAASLAALTTHEKAQLSVARISRVLGSEHPPPMASLAAAKPKAQVAVTPTLLAGAAPPAEEVKIPSAPPAAASSRGAVAAKTVGNATGGAWGTSSAPEEKGKGRGMLIGGAVALVVVLGVGGAILFGGKKPTGATADPIATTQATAPAGTGPAQGAATTATTTMEKLAPPEATVVVPPIADTAKVEPASTSAKPVATHATPHATSTAATTTAKPVASTQPVQTAPTSTSKSPLNIQLK